MIVKTLALCLAASTFAAIAKILYGRSSNSLAFIADGVHSLFDSSATVIGMISVLLATKPPDANHPYGHRKFETVSALILSVLLLFAAYEVGAAAYERLSQPALVPQTSFLGIAILVAAMVVNLAVARLESRRARELASQFLAADSLHNQSDFWITGGVLVSMASAHFRLPYADATASLAIAIYLVYLSIRLLLINLKPLVDSSVLDPARVVEIAQSTEGVILCHHVRSRGEQGHHFLDLNIHLPGHITLEKAHEITHNVEARLKRAFPGLVDVVIHTEPHNHPPCSTD